VRLAHGGLAGEAPRVPVGNSGFGFPPRFKETRPVEDPGCRGLSPRPGCPPGTRGLRLLPRDLRSRGIEDHGERVPGTRFTGRPGRSAPLTGRGIEPRDLRSRPVEDPGCRKAPGSRAARAERPSRGGGYAITGEKDHLKNNNSFSFNELNQYLEFISRVALARFYIYIAWDSKRRRFPVIEDHGVKPRVSKKRGGSGTIFLFFYLVKQIFSVSRKTQGREN
jgi:hypothetical protein